ncbi:MAG: NAD-dependent epimerase/dehydratase family protein [Mycoplasmoidaceae bacterium]|nr:NAD-dependent epimerase/dehydratase family protein [Mycoplasmoidaceae bacterium]
MGLNTRICIVGITGSIGTQTVKIANKLGYSIVGCSYHHNVELAKKLIEQNKIKYAYCSSDDTNDNCTSFDDLIKKCKPDLVVNAIVGFAGLKATLAALDNHVNLALANKESVVVAG